MARLLFLTPQVPYPPQQGTTIRNYHIIAHLARRHEVHLLSFQQQGDEPPENSPLANFCPVATAVPAPRRSTIGRALTTLFHPAPDMALRLASGDFQARLGMLLERYRYDVVQVEGIEMAPHGLWMVQHPLWRSARLKEDRPGIPIGRPRLVFDDHNAEYVLQQRAWETDRQQPRRWHGAAYSYIQWKKLRRYERRIAREADCVIAVSDADREALLRLDPCLDPVVVPNGVDLAYYTAYDDQRGATLPDAGPNDLVFTGKMDFRPNIDAVAWFVREVLPLIRQRVPDARFLIVGKSPHRRVLELAADPAVVVTGEVPDVRPWIAAAAVYVAPLRIGGGTRLKVLEALAMRAALVSTRLGCEGFPLEDGEAVAFGDSPGAFADAVVALLGDPARRARMGEAGRAFVEASYGWESIVPKVEDIYRRLGVNSANNAG